MLDPYYIFVSIVLGIAGLGALRYGKQAGSVRHIAIAIVLMIVPYFLIDAKLLALGGGALIVFLFWP